MTDKPGSGSGTKFVRLLGIVHVLSGRASVGAGVLAGVSALYIVLLLIVSLVVTDHVPPPSTTVPPVVLALALWFWMGIRLGGSRLVRWRHPLRSRFPPPVAAMTALASSAFLCLPVLVAAVRRLTGPEKPIHEYNPGTRSFVPNTDKKAMAPYLPADVHAALVESRLLLLAALLVTLCAVAVAIGDVLRRQLSPRASLFSNRLGQLLAPARGLAVAVAVGGLAVAALAGAHLVSRGTAYMRGEPLPARGTVEMYLPAGQETIFVGCPVACPPRLMPQQVIVSHGGGPGLLVFSDPTEDRLTVGDKTFGGAVSFTVPESGSYAISTRGLTRWRLRLAVSEGQEVRALALWIAAGVLGLALFVGELFLAIRYRHASRKAAWARGDNL